MVGNTDRSQVSLRQVPGNRLITLHFSEIIMCNKSASCIVTKIYSDILAFSGMWGSVYFMNTK